jgi:hypothetical protein
LRTFGIKEPPVFIGKKSVSKNCRFQAFERIKEPPISGIWKKKISFEEPPGFTKELAKTWWFEVDILFLSKNLRTAVICHKRVFDFLITMVINFDTRIDTQ